MVDLTMINEEQEIAARALGELAKSPRGDRAALEKEVALFFEDATWTTVSWGYYWWYRFIDYRLRVECERHLIRIAHELGAGTALLETLLPDFAFRDGALEVDYGRRGALRLLLRDDNSIDATLGGRPVSSLPGPLKADDERKILETRADVVRLKKEIRRTDRLLRRHLEGRLGREVHWSAAAWRAAMANPFFRNVARENLWVAFGNPVNRFRGLFAADDGGEPVRLDDSTVDLNEIDVVRLATRRMLTAQDCRDWGLWFAERRLQCEEVRPRAERTDPPGKHARASHASYLQAMRGEEIDRAESALKYLGWRHRSRIEASSEVTWFTKELEAGEPHAAVVARSNSYDASTFYAFIFPDSDEFVPFCDVPRIRTLEVLHDLQWAQACRKGMPGYAPTGEHTQSKV